MKVMVEILEAPEVLHEGDLHLYVQRWNADTFSLGAMEEFIISEKATPTEFKQALAAHYGIDEAALEVFKCEMYYGLDLLEVPSRKWIDPANIKLGAYSTHYKLEMGGLVWYCKDGDLFLFKVLHHNLSRALSHLQLYSLL